MLLDEWTPKLTTGDPDAVLVASHQLPAPIVEANTTHRTAARYLHIRRNQLMLLSVAEKTTKISVAQEVLALVQWHVEVPASLQLAQK